MRTTAPVKKRKLGSYPFVSVVFSISLALFVIGLLGLLILHSQKLTRLIKENVEMQVYLNKDVSNSQKTQIRHSLQQSEFVSKDLNGVPQVSFVSKHQAEENFIAETGEDFASFLGENPLRDVFTIKIDEAHQTEEQMAAIKKRLAILPGVYEVEYVGNLVKSINKNIANISLVLAAFAGLLVFVVIILINNTIKLALFTQRFLIRSMQLVGATNGFIRKPFLLRSIGHGIISGIIASAALFGVSEYGYRRIEDLVLLKDVNQLYLLFAVLLFLGGFLGFFSTLRSVNKYLKLSLDELY
ncbi:MAG: permease-like cell division protein FtsX [Cyclobacteriaceae bacterium]|nr:permease-like cell division protein FtsX [Cyclobacteriaceae bacterium]